MDNDLLSRAEELFHQSTDLAQEMVKLCSAHSPNASTHVAIGAAILTIKAYASTFPPEGIAKIASSLIIVADQMIIESIAKQEADPEQKNG